MQSTRFLVKIIILLIFCAHATGKCPPSGDVNDCTDLDATSGSKRYKTCRDVAKSTSGKALCLMVHAIKDDKCKCTCKFAKCKQFKEEETKEPEKPKPTDPPPTEASKGATPAANPGCFPPDAMLRLEGGGRVEMQNAKAGMMVQALTADNTVEYQPIKFWMHADPLKEAEYVEVETSRGAKLSLTTRHLVYRVTCVDDKPKSRELVMAKTLKVDDCVIIGGAQEAVSVDKVGKIATTWKAGLYAPLTDHGTVMVNDVATSCFTDFESEKVIDYFRSIFQWMPDFAAKPLGEELSYLAHSLVDAISVV